MLHYTLNRILLFIPILFGLSMLTFIYIHLIPGDPVQAMIGPTGTPEMVAQMRHELGLDRPIYVQYLDWVGGALHGDLGISFRSRQPITPLLLDRIPATLELAGAALAFAILLGLPSGILAGLHKNTRFDYVFSLLSLGGYSMPVFWISTLLLLVVGVQWKLLPSQGYIPFGQDPVGNLRLLILPAISLGLGLAPYIGRMARAAVIETLQESFVGYANAKGLHERTVFWRYIFRHAIVAILVVLGLDIGFLLSGQIIVEEIFNWPGAGRIVVRGVLERDYYVVEATILLYALLFLAINFVVEVLHGVLDPRVQLK
jgi:peptide/nickel transport system permease protein